MEQAIEDALWPLITSANVACGAHAGDDSTMKHAFDQARRYGVRIGAHPSYPDRENFGRRSLDLPAVDLRDTLVDQLQRLKSFASLSGISLERVKPHGALYHDLHLDRARAGTFVDAIIAVDRTISVVTALSSQLAEVALERCLCVVREAFGDRRYRADGSLVSRREANALLLEPGEAAEQASRLAATGTVVAEDGSEIAIPFDTICVHGDMEGSPERVRRIRERLEEGGFRFQ